MKKRDFLKTTVAAASTALLPSSLFANIQGDKRLRTAHIGVGGMGAADLKSISSHDRVDVTALCDVDANNLAAAKLKHPNAKTFSDYRVNA